MFDKERLIKMLEVSPSYYYVLLVVNQIKIRKDEQTRFSEVQTSV